MKKYFPLFSELEEHQNDRAWQLFSLLHTQYSYEGDESCVLDSWCDLYHNGYCDSPIEYLLAASLLFSNNGYERIQLHGSDFFDWKERTPEDLCEKLHTIIIPQWKIGKYTADFYAVTNTGAGIRYLIIECDGHDFHEKTKEQAAKDKQRDRAIASLGIPILRFTGSEIYRTPLKCAEEIQVFLMNQIDDVLAEAGIIVGRKRL